MKITIYELLGLIKDGKAPKKIKCDGDIYNYEFQNTIAGAYEYRSKNFGCLMTNISGHLYLTDILNAEVEIIEEVEDKEYEDIEEINYYPKNKTEFQVDYYEDGELKHFCLNKKQRYFADKINALIRNQKYILERLDKND